LNSKTLIYFLAGGEGGDGGETTDFDAAAGFGGEGGATSASFPFIFGHYFKNCVN